MRGRLSRSTTNRSYVAALETASDDHVVTRVIGKVINRGVEPRKPTANLILPFPLIQDSTEVVRDIL